MGRLLARNFSGPSIKFDGSATKIVSGNALDLNAGTTMCVWAHTGFPVSMRLIGAAASGGLSFGITGSSTLSFVKAGVSAVGSGYAASKLPKNKWVFLAGSYSSQASGSVVAYYLNGALILQEANDQHPLTSTGHVIGGELTTNYQAGYIAEPAIFNRVLTAEEIRAIYEQGPDAYPKDGSCVLDYRFKEGAIDGAQIVDSSGKGNHGTLTLGAGRIDPYNIPVPNRVVIPGNMPLVGIESTGANNLNITDANISAAFGVDAGQVGVNGISVGAWIKKKRHVSNYQAIVNKALTITRGAFIDLGTNLDQINPIACRSGTNSTTYTTRNHKNVVFAASVSSVPKAVGYINGVAAKTTIATHVTQTSDTFSLITAASGNITTISMPFLANRALTDSEVYNIYSKSIFPADVLFWHGPDETGTKIACYRGSYSPINRVPSCDGTLPAGITFTDDTPWR